ncbi:hypothetical protein E2C01_042232 [Portunus trituberculatus]|uniref:Uncharacterized protein n=1 Tax=Portunus trituberculatus TaxID=210409 RepID=A0A5B7FT47_PORTR|nr:hypothetical protein [Portunus trituberculatus]
MTQRVWPCGVWGRPAPRPVLLGEEEAPSASSTFPKRYMGQRVEPSALPRWPRWPWSAEVLKRTPSRNAALRGERDGVMRREVAFAALPHVKKLMSNLLSLVSNYLLLSLSQHHYLQPTTQQQ